VNRLASILLLVCFAALGSGALLWLHDHQHRHEDAARAAEARAAGAPTPEHKHHDESNCDLHARLQRSVIAGGWVPLLVLLGVFVAFLTLLPASPVDRRTPLRIDCRGPPAC
jgi:hypothetical protein